MSKISFLLAQILSAVYGKDVRQSIHDSIAQCYADVSASKTLADNAATAANQAASNAKDSVSEAVSDMQTQTNAAIGECNAAVTAANAATASANTKANAANTAAAAANASKQACDEAVATLPSQLQAAFCDIGLSVQEGRLCVTVKRSE